MKNVLSPLLSAVLLLCVCPALAADSVASQTSVDTVWIIVAAALVFFMQAGFALLESGMSRAKNTVNVIMKNYADVCVGSLVFCLVGFGLMFGANPTGFWGTDHFLLNPDLEWDWSVVLFQAMFAATAATIASGTMAERTRFNAYLVAACVVMGFLYPVFGSWAWGSAFEGTGWLAELGFIDFAGSTVVHSLGAWVALAGALVVGPRIGRFDSEGRVHRIPGHNLSYVAMGGFILWFGWFGFNGGSTLGADVSIGLINLNTHLAACAGAAGALLACALGRKPILVEQVVNGSIGGLVSITAGCATMDPLFAVVTGLIAGLVVVYGSRLLLKMRVDDVVGAIPVHGFAGAWGTIAAGLFYAEDMLSIELVIVQCIGVLTCFLWAFVGSLIIYGLVNWVMPLRAEPLHEQRGLDITEHAELGYPEFTKGNAYNEKTLEVLER
ncbi:ammonium transporter [Gilvimarinus agarilyticus]|uniref:ammonium transporter n=1 Tax=unclassified Gilvimarinus TaxID=2642066 RepID=UPI001C09BF85|nr:MULTISPECIES: ammonium transporter [unclassified Gilvimarinus]MBU2885318.1 ammonium transporter [Gilvimarinus agarilyticus]MDO6570217.1 ammonium transporter [Gilvimarinus sp. 2_MG-2023]MDO6748212.1 ammonium transporter [Gilvimarinus sp. 1_MG-2023]